MTPNGNLSVCSDFSPTLLPFDDHKLNRVTGAGDLARLHDSTSILQDSEAITQYFHPFQISTEIAYVKPVDWGYYGKKN